jgi:hypothetical protein
MKAIGVVFISEGITITDTPGLVQTERLSLPESQETNIPSPRVTLTKNIKNTYYIT